MEWRVSRINTGVGTARITVVAPMEDNPHRVNVIAEPLCENAEEVARLIAAAPRLEATIREFLALFGNPHPDDFSDDGSSYKLAKDIVERANKLLVEIADG